MSGIKKSIQYKYQNILFLFLISANVFAQNSLLVNFGTNNCSNNNIPSFSIIHQPLSSSPMLFSNCDMQQQQTDISSVFVAYNPKNNKVYVSDIRNGTQTNIWVLDIGLPNDITCPGNIPINPTYSYSYISNNFEFDNNGNLWSFSNYDLSTGQGSLDMFDVNNGNVINTRQMQFPVGDYPNTILSGDLCILPNGRMFATLGTTPSKLYEIVNYNNSTMATAIYLTDLPNDCYGIAYLNGILEITGNDFSGFCYYFKYDFTNRQLQGPFPFQNNHSPIDNSSLSPAIGCTKRLLNAVRVDSGIYELTYEIYLENMGNVLLNNVNIVDDLANTFGATNVSNVQVNFVTGFNEAGLTLNPGYNGITSLFLLNPNQTLSNNISTTTDYRLKIELTCRVSNISSGRSYLNQAIAKAQIGNVNNNTLIDIVDTSNNGNYLLIDPNQNGIANEVNENNPTPFAANALPIKSLDLYARLINKENALLTWNVPTPVLNGESFIIEFSLNGERWTEIGKTAITNADQSKYELYQYNIPKGILYYRIKQQDKDGSYFLSKIVQLKNNFQNNGYVIYPNPASKNITIASLNSGIFETNIDVLDILGKRLGIYKMNTGRYQINTTGFSNGIYLLKISDNANTYFKRIVIQH